MVSKISVISVLLFTAFSIVMSACGATKASQQDYRKSARERQIDSISNPVVSGSGSVMKFDTVEMDVGIIKETDNSPEYEFTWTNVGKTPITIVSVTTSCTCASPSFERKPVGSGEKGSLTITYHPKGFPGNFSRRILVYTDLSGKLPAAVLTLKGSVQAPDVPVWAYRHQMGNLYLRRTEVKFTPGQKAEERIACLNAGNTPLTIGAEAALLPPYISFRCEPRTIEPGEEANIYITYDPEAAPMRMLNVVPLILTGLDLSPSQRTVKVVFEDKKLKLQN